MLRFSKLWRLSHAAALTAVDQLERLVARDFRAEAPDRLWVADNTYVPTWAGFLYLAVVLDVFSRWVVHWAIVTKTRLVLDALEMALARRWPESVIPHSDQGSQYTSIAFRQRCAKAGVRPSMGTNGAGKSVSRLP